MPPSITGIFHAALILPEDPLERLTAPAGTPQSPSFNFGPRISDDGRYVAFLSGDRLVAADGDAASDVYLYDRQTDSVKWLSKTVSFSNIVGNESLTMTPDGGFIAFTAYGNLVGDDGGGADVYVYDRAADKIEKITNHALVGSTSATNIEISPNGRFVVFDSVSQLVTDGDGANDVFLYDRTTKQMHEVSTGLGGISGSAHKPQVSDNGNIVAYVSERQITTADTDGFKDIFVHDRATGTTTRISNEFQHVTLGGNEGAQELKLSADGRYIAYHYDTEIYFHDRQAGTTTRLTTPAQPSSTLGAAGLAMTPDGKFVVFGSRTNNLVAGDTDSGGDLFLWSRDAGTLKRIGAVEIGTGPGGVDDLSPQITPDGRYVTFETRYGLSPDDANSAVDAYVYDTTTGLFARMSPEWEISSPRGTTNARLTPDGQTIVYETVANVAASNDTNNMRDIYASTNVQERFANSQSGRVLTFDISVDGATSLVIDWGDGATETKALSGGPQTVRLSHAYSNISFNDGSITLKSPGQPDLVRQLNVIPERDTGIYPYTEVTSGDGVAFVTNNSPLYANRNFAGGGAGADFVAGWTGDDRLWGGTGNDVIDGGPGRDIATYAWAGTFLNSFQVSYSQNADGSWTVTSPDGVDTLRNIEVLEFNDRSVDLVPTDTANFAASFVGLAINLITRVAFGGHGQEDLAVGIVKVIGSLLNDGIVGDAAANILRGLGGADFLFGGALDGTSPTGDDTLDGGDGNDGLWGWDGGDTLEGGTGSDSLVGGAGNDVMNGGGDADFLFGGDFSSTGLFVANSGNDTLNGGDGNDGLWGFDGDDTINGDAGNDVAFAGAGVDTVSGGVGNDYLLGEAGNDTIGGGTGFDYLYGGAGADTFVFKKGDSADWILDFSSAEGDKLKLEGFGFANFAAAPLVDLSSPGNPAVQLTFIEGGQVDQLTIFGATLAQLNATNVLFA